MAMLFGLGETRQSRSRLLFAAFWTLVLSFHLRALTTGAGYSDSWLLFLLSLAAILAAGAAVIARDHGDGVKSGSPDRKMAPSITEPILARQIEAELRRTHHVHGPVGLMIVEVGSILGSSGEGLADKHRVLTVVEELLEHHLQPGFNTIRSGRHVALVIWDSEPSGTLERIADRLKRDARAWLSEEPGLRHFQLTFGIAASKSLKGSGSDLVRRASIAVSRAKTLGASQYAAGEGLR